MICTYWAELNSCKGSCNFNPLSGDLRRGGAFAADSFHLEDQFYALEDDVDPLDQHIFNKGLPLERSGITLSDGNCWYDAVADQVKLLDIKGVARDHKGLRSEICQALPKLAQAPEWLTSVFRSNSRRFGNFVSKHERGGEWTDDRGIMCHATALYLGRNINVVGTINANEAGPGYSVVEGGPGAENRDPLYVGYYQDQHYQSLKQIGGLALDTVAVEEDAVLGSSSKYPLGSFKLISFLLILRPCSFTGNRD